MRYTKTRAYIRTQKNGIRLGTSRTALKIRSLADHIRTLGGGIEKEVNWVMQHYLAFYSLRCNIKGQILFMMWLHIRPIQRGVEEQTAQREEARNLFRIAERMYRVAPFQPP